MKKASLLLMSAFAIVSMTANAAPPPSLHPDPKDEHVEADQVDHARGAWQGAQYVYGSGEGAAISRQAYSALLSYVLTEISLPRAQWRSVILDGQASLAQPSFTSCKPGSDAAVIFDADETLLQNRGQEYAAIQYNQGYTPERWQQWERESAQYVDAVPGAKEAVEQLRANKVKVIVVTNRDGQVKVRQANDPADFAQYTIDALGAAGLGQFHHDLQSGDIFLSGDYDDPTKSYKDGRRAFLSGKYCVLAMAGDQLGDFSDLFNEVPSAKGLARRDTTAGDEISRMWGQGWFVLPNPIYGSAVPYPGNVEDVFPDKTWSYPKMK